MAKAVEWTATPATVGRQEKRKAKSPQKKHPENVRVETPERAGGHNSVWEAASEPPADILGNTDESQKNFSMHEDASCCHPSAGMPRTPRRRSAMSCDKQLRSENGGHHPQTDSDCCVCHLRVPLMDHSQAVRPTGPMCWHTSPPSALQPTSAEVK